MKELFEQVIQRREYDLKSLLTCIDQYHIEGKLTDDERQELAQAAREGATADYDYAGEINALWAAVRALQQSISPPTEDEWPEFVQPTGAGTAYQVGDKVTFNGRSLYLPVAALCMEPGGLSHRLAETGIEYRL